MPNSKRFANALVALHKAGLLNDPACKSAIKTLIRQATEDKHWHLSVHYRSKDAAKAIRAAKIATPAEYQRFCKKHLRHEHMVPGGEVYKMILAAKPSVRVYEQILRDTGFRATITKLEDNKLKRDKMPPEYFEPGNRLYQNHKARYIKAKLASQLVRRPLRGWFK